jgi:hypothetical protein
MDTVHDLLGAECSDYVTGFAGIATGVAQYLSGGRKVLIESRTPTGDPKERWVPIDRVVMADDRPTPEVYL